MSHVHRTQSVSAVFCPFFLSLPSVTVEHHRKLQVAYTRKVNTFSNETCLYYITVIYSGLSTRLLNHYYRRCTELETENSSEGNDWEKR